ncbi:hypothetical protein ACFL0O_02585, partial [Thermodesulfobacteriota bacterium]
MRKNPRVIEAYLGS